ncbi:MAG: RuBisCO large subunit C-terminal-like domain-containing protein [Rhodothermales bacterium]
MKFLEATYRVTGSNFRERIESVLLEQTIETPVSVAEQHPFVRENMMGRVEQVVQDGAESYLATLSLPVLTAFSDPAQLLNVLFGNSSLHADVMLEDFNLPQTVTDLLPGPRFGISGLREAAGVHGRPLTCSAIKPVGLRIDEMAEICRAFGEAGVDLIKDDHYLANQSFATFHDRVRACQAVVEDVAERTGRRPIYVPNLSGTPDVVRRQAEWAQEAGVRAVMMAPMLLGMPLLHELRMKVLDIPILAHPSFGGSVRIKTATLLGKIFRLYGADAVIFANYGGRFSYPPEVCRDIAGNLRAEWLGLNKVFPVPAGGMDADRAEELVHFFGNDTILLVGGSLLEAGPALRDKSERFVESVHAAAEGNIGV